MCEKAISFCTERCAIESFKQTILPVLYYGSIVWLDCPKGMSDKLERLQNQALRTPTQIEKKCEKRKRKKCGLTRFAKESQEIPTGLQDSVHDYNCPEHLISYLPSWQGLHSRSLKDEYFLNLASMKSAVGQKLFNIPLPMTGTFNRKGKDQQTSKHI